MVKVEEAAGWSEQSRRRRRRGAWRTTRRTRHHAWSGTSRRTRHRRAQSRGRRRHARSWRSRRRGCQSRRRRRRGCQSRELEKEATCMELVLACFRVRSFVLWFFLDSEFEMLGILLADLDLLKKERWITGTETNRHSTPNAALDRAKTKQGNPQ